MRATNIDWTEQIHTLMSVSLRVYASLFNVRDQCLGAGSFTIHVYTTENEAYPPS